MLTSLQQLDTPAIFCLSPPTSKISDSPGTLVKQNLQLLQIKQHSDLNDKQFAELHQLCFQWVTSTCFPISIA